MIRRVSDMHPATPDQLRRRARHRAHMAWQWDVPADCPECGVDCGGRCRENGEHTEIRLCPACRHFHALQTHCEALCERRHGVPAKVLSFPAPMRDPLDDYGAFFESCPPAYRCAAHCGALVSSVDSYCLSCVGAA